MNRKLIRPNLADVKGKERDSQITRDQRSGGVNSGGSFVRRPNFPTNASSAPAPPPARVNNIPPTANDEGSQSSRSASAPTAAVSTATEDANAAATAAKNRRLPPPVETNAEIFYYKKQIDSHTLMVIVLIDNEEIEGTIEWYDRNAIKVNRTNAPNIMLLKHNIKYMFKADERVVAGEGSS
jgi:sRNA-binding regulator protein Hfq